MLSGWYDCSMLLRLFYHVTYLAILVSCTMITILASCSQEAHHCEAAAESFLSMCLPCTTSPSLYSSLACAYACLHGTRHACPHTLCITAPAKCSSFSQQAYHCEAVAERIQMHSAACTAAPKACAKSWAVYMCSQLVAVQPEIWFPAP